LSHRIRAIKEEGNDLFENLSPDVYRTMYAIARLRPIDLARRDLATLSFSAIAKLDLEQVPAQDDCDSMKRIAMPGRGLARGQALSPDQAVSVVVQDLLFSLCGHEFSLVRFVGSSHPALG
jgi:hypothetical protein